MDITFRPERPADYRETETLTREAFWNHHTPGCDEHYLLHILRGSPAFVPALDIVAVDGGKIVGNVVYVRGLIQADAGSEYHVLSLGPISVLPQYQGRGIGGRLIQHTRALACKMGERAILLCGDPAYYTRQGFVPAETLGIRMADDMYATALHACELYPGALSGASGRYCEDTIYQIDEAAAAAFDESFPAKERVTGTPSQKRFQEIVALRRKAEC